MIKFSTPNYSKGEDHEFNVPSFAIPSRFTIKLILAYSAALRVRDGKLMDKYVMILN